MCVWAHTAAGLQVANAELPPLLPGPPFLLVLFYSWVVLKAWARILACTEGLGFLTVFSQSCLDVKTVRSLARRFPPTLHIHAGAAAKAAWGRGSEGEEAVMPAMGHWGSCSSITAPASWDEMAAALLQ